MNNEEFKQIEGYETRLKSMLANGAVFSERLISDLMFSELIELRCLVAELQNYCEHYRSDRDRWIGNCSTLLSQLDKYEPNAVIGGAA